VRYIQIIKFEMFQRAFGNFYEVLMSFGFYNSNYIGHARNSLTNWTPQRI